MIRAEAVVARLLVFAMQLPYLTKATGKYQHRFAIQVLAYKFAIVVLTQ